MPRSYPPEPEESGSLQPPRRRPPTAVGTATQPPRKPYKRGNYRGFRSNTRLAALSVLSVTLGCCAVAPIATLTPWGLVVGVGCLLGGLGVTIRIRADVVARRSWRARRAERRAQRRAA